MNISKKEVGKCGEDYAVSKLQEKGFVICDRNYNTVFGEVDIICKKDNTLYLVEVKSRLSDGSGFAEDLINYRKLRYMSRSASYIQRVFDSNLPVEVVVMTVTFVSIYPVVVDRVGFYFGSELYL